MGASPDRRRRLGPHRRHAVRSRRTERCRRSRFWRRNVAYIGADAGWRHDFASARSKVKRCIERRRHFARGHRRRSRDALRQFKDVTHECRLLRRANPNRRRARSAARAAVRCCAQDTLGGTGTLGEIAHDIGRQSRRRAFPIVGQQSMKIRSPATMVLTVISRSSAKRSARLSGSPRIAPHSQVRPCPGRRSAIATGRLKRSEQDVAGGHDLGLDVASSVTHKPRKTVLHGQAPRSL